MKIHLFFGYDNNALERARNTLECAMFDYNDSVYFTYRFPELYQNMSVHPKIQLKIFEDLMNQWKTYFSPLIFITTHSEHIMLWLCREIKLGKLSAQDITVTWVFGEPDPQKWIDISSPDAFFLHDIKTLDLRLDNDGDFIDKWPNGFFDERMNLFFNEPE